MLKEVWTALLLPILLGIVMDGKLWDSSIQSKMMAAPSVARVGFDKNWSVLVNSETSNEKSSDFCLAYCYIRIDVAVLEMQQSLSCKSETRQQTPKSIDCSRQRTIATWIITDRNRRLLVGPIL